MALVPQEYHDLLEDSSRSIMILTTLLSDGSPVVTPIWFVAEGESCFITTAPDATKAKNLRAQPKVAFVLMAQNNHARYIHMRVMAEELPTADLTSLYNQIVQKYEGRLPTSYPAQTVFRFTPFKVSVFDYSDYQP